MVSPTADSGFRSSDLLAFDYGLRPTLRLNGVSEESEPSARHLARGQMHALLVKEGLAEQLEALLARAEETENRIHPIVEIAPVRRRALVKGPGGSIEAGQQLDELRVTKLLEHVGENATVRKPRQISSKAQVTVGQTQPHDRPGGEDAPRTGGGCVEPVSQTAPSEDLHRRLEQVSHRRIERLENVGLQAGLLVQSNLDVRQQDE